MSFITLSHPTKIITGNFTLPSSKSMSNRLLILNALSSGKIKIHNLSDADDTLLMRQALMQDSGTINIKNAGTCMRFLTAYFAATSCDVTLTGDTRMCERPIGTLVSALRSLGASVEYMGQEGFPPLRIKGQELIGGTIRISPSASSQFISALMLIAPIMKSGLTLENEGGDFSSSYIGMTEQLMTGCGLDVAHKKNTIIIPSQKFTKRTFTVEADWSSASYWYAFGALCSDCRIVLPGLTHSNLQGDRKIADFMSGFGVDTLVNDKGIILTKNDSKDRERYFDMKDTPDLVPAMAVALAAMNVEAVFEDINNLRIKESDRVAALINELRKCGFQVASSESELIIHTNPGNSKVTTKSVPEILTYNDHRIAMAFAALALYFPAIRIENSEVVEKSYPGFWIELKKAGFVIEGNF